MYIFTSIAGSYSCKPYVHLTDIFLIFFNIMRMNRITFYGHTHLPFLILVRKVNEYDKYFSPNYNDNVRDKEIFNIFSTIECP